MRTHAMGEMTVKEIREYLKTNKTIIVPYGVVEQHGYHLPLSMDIHNAEVPSYILAEKLGCIVAPPLNYCFSGGQLPGTINVRPTTFCAMMCDIVDALAGQGFENILIFPGHGGTESLAQLREALRIQKWLNPALADDLILLCPIWDFSPTWTKLFQTRDYHAAEAETSLLLHWCPEVVRKKIRMDKPAVAERLRDDPDSYQHRVSFTALKQEVVQTSQRDDVKIGVMGYPERANAALGAKIEAEFLKNAGKELAKAIKDADKARKSGKRIVHEDNDKLKILAL